MKFSFLRSFLALGSILLLLGSCDIYPDDEAREGDLDVVLSYYDTEANFGALKTYAIIDSIRQITDDTISTPIADNPISRKNSDFILDVVKTNMGSLGYELVNDPNAADMAINVGAVVNRNIDVTTFYPGYYWGCGIYWCDPGYWYGYPGYGYYYPWFPTTVVSTYEVGTLVIDMVDLKNFNPASDPGLPMVWTGIVRGVVSKDNNSTRARARDGINQAFDQSPYLGSNN